MNGGGLDCALKVFVKMYIYVFHYVISAKAIVFFVVVNRFFGSNLSRGSHKAYLFHIISEKGILVSFLP